MTKFIVLLLSALFTTLGSPDAALADKFIQEIRSNLTSAADGPESMPFHVLVESRCVDGYVTYKITNLSADWPKHTFVGIFWAGTESTYARQRVKLRKGEAYVLRADFKGFDPQPIDLWLKPAWVKQDFIVRFRHTPPLGWHEAGKKRS